jgi:hypothetical protein
VIVLTSLLSIVTTKPFEAVPTVDALTRHFVLLSSMITGWSVPSRDYRPERLLSIVGRFFRRQENAVVAGLSHAAHSLRKRTLQLPQR